MIQLHGMCSTDIACCFTEVGSYQLVYRDVRFKITNRVALSFDTVLYVRWQTWPRGAG